MTTITLPTTQAEENFRRTPELVTQLQEALSLTSVKVALDILKDEARPKSSLPEPVAGLHPDTNLAHYYHFLMGCNAVLDRLNRLAKRYNASEALAEDPDEFDHFAANFQPLPPIPETK